MSGGGERTEAATPRKLQQLRDDGQAARSPELGSAIGLLAGCFILQATAAGAAGRMQALLTGSFLELGTATRGGDDLLWAEQLLANAGEAWLLSIAPLMLALPVIGIGVGFAQGGIISFKAMFHPQTLNPMSGFKRMFSMQALLTLGRSLLKVGLVAAFTWRGLQQTLEKLALIQGSTDPRALAAFIGQAMLDVALPAAQVLLVLAIADYAYQRWQFMRQARMSKEEVKQEHKQQEGDPLLKGMIRAR